MYLPGVAYTLDQGLAPFSSGFDTNLLSTLSAQDFHGVPVYPISVTESSEEPVQRIWTDAEGAVWTNTAPPLSYSPTNWVLGQYSSPAYLSPEDRDVWIAARKLDRQTLVYRLIANEELALCLSALSNQVSTGMTTLPSNQVGAVGFNISPDQQTLQLFIQSPEHIDAVGIYEVDDLLDFPWTHHADIPHQTDPIETTLQLETDHGYFALVDHVSDVDGDGLLDAIEALLLGTRTDVQDSDGDGADDRTEVMLHGTDPLSSDTDGDGLLDGFEITNGINPHDAAGINGADGDLDGDGLSNLTEQNARTDPRNPDTLPPTLGLVCPSTSSFWIP